MAAEKPAASARPAEPSFEERSQLQQFTARLREHYDRFVIPPDLKLGDIVVWKEGLANRRFPRPGTVAIVTRIYPQPLFDPKKFAPIFILILKKF